MPALSEELERIREDIDKGRIKEAIEALRRILPNARRDGGAKEAALAHLLLGKALTRSGELLESAQAYKKALELYESIPDGNGIAEALLGLGVVHRWRSDFATAEEVLNSFLDQAAEIGNQEQVGQAHTELGIVLAERAVQEGAIAHFKEAIDILERTPNAYQLSRAHQSLGETLKRMGRFSEAYEALEQCIKVAEGLKLERNLAYASASAAECLAKSGAVDKADRYVETAIVIFKRTADEIGLADALRVHAVVEWKKGDAKLAEELFKESIKMIAKKDVPSNELALRFDYAMFLADLKRFEEADEQANISIKLAKKSGAVGLEDRAWRVRNAVRAARKASK